MIGHFWRMLFRVTLLLLQYMETLVGSSGILFKFVPPSFSLQTCRVAVNCLHAVIKQYVCMCVRVCVHVCTCICVCTCVCTLVLYRLPHFRSVLIFDYFKFQVADISIRYRLLQTYNKTYKISKFITNIWFYFKY